jgi:ABC-type lipoprotein release transport system permease subunit
VRRKTWVLAAAATLTALAATGHIRTQFLCEAVLLGLLGGTAGVAIGALATTVYAHTKHWAAVIPTEAWAGGIAASLIIGAVAGLIPALRAARLSPTQPCGPSSPPTPRALPSQHHGMSVIR